MQTSCWLDTRSQDAYPYEHTPKAALRELGIADLMYETGLLENRNGCRDAIYRVSTFKFIPGFSNAGN